jgi:hypothetical protein
MNIYSVGLIACLALWLGLPDVSIASTCTEGSMGEFGAAMRAHNVDVYRMERKFQDTYYFQGGVPGAVVSEGSLSDIRNRLRELQPRRAAVLFYFAQGRRLCAWLISNQRPDIVGVAQAIEPHRHLSAETYAQVLEGARRGRTARSGGSAFERMQLDATLRGLSELLLPPPVSRVLLDDRIDTLIVVPVGIGANTAAVTAAGNAANPLSISTVPFLALSLGDRQVADHMSVVIAPGFRSFHEPLPPHRRSIDSPVIAAAPVRLGLDPLPGALAEAEAIASFLRTRALVAAEARKDRLLRALRASADTVDFVLIATHARADAADPLDRSVLEFSDGSLSAREIGNFGHYFRRRPIVVLSACESGSGRHFPAGTIGLARAWLRAGASQVVVSSWSVHDDSTGPMMIELVDRIRGGVPVDIALRSAALSARRDGWSWSVWAAFSVLGLPQRSW